jgi:hypothetical protein
LQGIYMPIPNSIVDLNVTPSLNSPAGTEDLLSADDYIRALSAIIKQQANNTAGAGANANITALLGLAGALNYSKSIIAATATTTPLWSNTAGNLQDWTGTPIVTSLPAAPKAGSFRIVYPQAGTTFVNSANLQIQGASNYTTGVGDRLLIEAITTTTFRIYITKLGSLAEPNADGVRPVTTSGTSSAYIVTPAGATLPLEDGQVFAIKFHADNVANATFEVFGISPVLNLKIQASDGAFVNVAAGDIIAGHVCLGVVIESETALLITPAKAVFNTVDIIASTTLTLENALDRTLLVKTNGVVLLLPLLSTFPEGGSFEVYSDAQLCFIQANGSDVISLNGADSVAFGLGASELVGFRKHAGKWLAIRSSTPRRLTHSFATDIIMPIGQTVEYPIIAQTSLPLRIATDQNQRYRGTFFCTDRPTANGTTPFLLNINNTTYASTITPIGMWATNAGVAAASGTAVGGFPLSNSTTGANFSFEFEISTSTFNKEVSVEFDSATSAGARVTGYIRAKSSDTTTPITSLGTINFGVTTTGILRIERIE